jgi:Ca-activated chloride channel family protein
MPQFDQFGRRVGSAPVKVDIDEETLKAIAQKTGGKYYRGDSSDTLRKVYDEIDRFEKSEAEVKKFVQVKELFQFAVLPGFFLFMLEVLLAHTVWRKLP